MSNSLFRLSTILKIGNRENATIISHPLTVSIDYPEKRLQENTTYKLEGIILGKKFSKQFTRNGEAVKRQDCKLEFGRCSKNKEHANKKHNTLGLCHTNDLKPCDKDMDWLLVSLVLSLYLCTVGLQSIEVL